MSDEDIIKMNTNINLTDSNGNPISVTTPQPEYITETFNFKPSINQNEIFTADGDDEWSSPSDYNNESFKYSGWGVVTLIFFPFLSVNIISDFIFIMSFELPKIPFPLSVYCASNNIR